MDLRSYFRRLLRRWPVLLTVFVLVGAALAGAGFFIPATYTSSVRMVFAPPNLSVTTGMETRQVADLYLTSRMKTYAQLVTTNQVLQPVIDSLGLGTTVPDLAKQLDITIPTARRFSTSRRRHGRARLPPRSPIASPWRCRARGRPRRCHRAR